MDQQRPDPTDVFRADQEAAEEEAKTRDQIIWDGQVADAHAATAMKMAHAQRVKAYSDLLEALTLALYLVLVAALAGGLYLVGRLVVGWFR